MFQNICSVWLRAPAADASALKKCLMPSAYKYPGLLASETYAPFSLSRALSPGVRGRVKNAHPTCIPSRGTNPTLALLFSAVKYPSLPPLQFHLQPVCVWRGRGGHSFFQNAAGLFQKAFAVSILPLLTSPAAALRAHSQQPSHPPCKALLAMA